MKTETCINRMTPVSRQPRRAGSDCSITLAHSEGEGRLAFPQDLWWCWEAWPHHSSPTLRRFVVATRVAAPGSPSGLNPWVKPFRGCSLSPSSCSSRAQGRDGSCPLMPAAPMQGPAAVKSCSCCIQRPRRGAQGGRRPPPQSLTQGPTSGLLRKRPLQLLQKASELKSFFLAGRCTSLAAPDSLEKGTGGTHQFVLIRGFSSLPWQLGTEGFPVLPRGSPCAALRQAAPEPPPARLSPQPRWWHQGLRPHLRSSSFNPCGSTAAWHLPPQAAPEGMRLPRLPPLLRTHQMQFSASLSVSTLEQVSLNQKYGALVPLS